MSLARGDRSGGGAGAIAVDALPSIAAVGRDALYRRRGDQSLWARGFDTVDAVDATITTVDISTLLHGSPTWDGVLTEHPYPQDAAAVYWNSDENKFYRKSAGSLGGSITTGTPTFNAGYNYLGALATEPTGTHSVDDIYFNTTDGNWYHFGGTSFTTVANPNGLFSDANAAWLAPPLDTEAEVLELFYEGSYSASLVYIYYDSSDGAVVEITDYTATTTDWGEATFAQITTRTGALTRYDDEADAIAELDANGFDSNENYGYVSGSTFLVVTGFTESEPEHEDPFWTPVSQALVRGPGDTDFDDEAARDAALTGTALMPYENSEYLLISVGDEIQRYVDDTWETVSGWAVGRRGIQGETGPLASALTKAQVEDEDSTDVGSMTGERFAEGVSAHEAYPWDVILAPRFYRADPSDLSSSEGGFTFEEESGNVFLKVFAGSHDTLHLESLLEHGEAVVLETTHHDEIFRMEFMSDWDESEDRIEIEVQSGYASLLTDGTRYELGFTQGRPDIGYTESELEDKIQEDVEDFALEARSGSMPLARYGYMPVSWLHDIELYARSYADTESDANFAVHTQSGQLYIHFQSVTGTFITGLEAFTLIGLYRAGETTRRDLLVITGDLHATYGYPVERIGHFGNPESDRNYDVYFSVEP